MVFSFVTLHTKSEYDLPQNSHDLSEFLETYYYSYPSLMEVALSK